MSRIIHANAAVIQELCSLLDITPSDDIDYSVSFQALGGNSLLALRLAGRCKRHGIRLLVNKILQSESLAEMLTSVSHLDTSCEGLLSDECAKHPSSVTPKLSDAVDSHSHGTKDRGMSDHNEETVNGTDSLELIQASGLQSSFLHESTKNPGTNIIQHVEIYERSDIPRVMAGWRTVWEQEKVLRTRYSTDLTPYEVTQFDWEEIYVKDAKDFEILTSDPRLRVTEEFGSSWRVINLTSTSKTSMLIWTIHHSLIDGYSAKLLLSKMRRAASGSPISAGPAFVGILRELERLRVEDRAVGDAFWDKQKDLLAEAARTLQFPAPTELSWLDKGSNLQPGNQNYGEHCVNMGAGWNQRVLSGVAKRAGVTPAIIYHAALALILTVFADSDKVCFGTALSGRNLHISGIEEAIGPLLNTLPLALCLEDAAMTMGELARETQRRLHELSQYSWTTPENGFSRNFQCTIAMQYQMDDYSTDLIDIVGAMDLKAGRPIERPFTSQTSDIPLSILVDEAYDEVRLRFSLSDFAPCQMENIGTLYRHVLECFVRLDAPISLVKTSLITPKAQRVLEDWGNCLSSTTSPLSIADDLVTLFERTADQHPDEVAARAVCGQHLTYREIDDKASKVAAALINEYDVHAGDIVCVDANRSLEWLVAILGVFKSGAAFCALDHELPQLQRSVIFAGTDARVFLASSRNIAHRLRPKDCPHTLSVEELVNSMRSQEYESSLANIRRRSIPMPESTTYVCFTSGSTGAPKGVVCTHQGLVAFQRDLQVRLFSAPGVNVAQIISPAFDGSIHEIFSTLCYGATLILPTMGEKSVTETLALAQSAILTPSLAEVLDPADYPSLKYVYLVGEQVKQSINDRWGAAKVLYNMYGPTEGTCGATIKRLVPGKPVTIGRPNPSSRVYILSTAASVSKNLRHMPPGTIGEICVAGVQVARGYLGKPDLTAKQFIQDPFCKTATSDYLYRTGDRGYWSPEGEIVFLGRNDRQIKLHGFRTDLNDLEARLAQATPGIDGLKSVAVAPGKDHLVVAIQPASLALTSEAVHKVLREVLPHYAQPRHVLFVDEWPMTRAGKLDYKALVSIKFIKGMTQENGKVRAEANGNKVQAPLAPLELKVANIWREVLGLGQCEPIERHSGFLQLGGDSLRQITMLAKLSSDLKARFPLKIVIESQTLGELTRRLEEFDPHLGDQHMHHPVPEPNFQTGPGVVSPPLRTPLSPAELSWWRRYQEHRYSNASSFNVSFVASLAANVDRKALCRALNTVVSRYSIFRGRYVLIVGSRHGDMDRGLAERCYVEHPPRVQRLRRLDIWAEVNRPFDLAKEPAIRLSLTDETLAIVMSHIVADLTTLNILLREVGILYHRKSLSPVTRNYEQEAVPGMWNHEPSPCDMDFWKQYIGSAQSGKNARRKRAGYSGTSRLYRLSSGLATRLLQSCVGQKNGSALSLQQMAVAAVALATTAMETGAAKEEHGSDHVDVVLGTPFINRAGAHDMEIVGLFLEPLPIRVRHTASCAGNSTQDAQDFLDSVRTSANAALAHAIPWHKLVAHANPSHQHQLLHPNLAYGSLAEPYAPFDTMVTFHHANNSVRLDIPGVLPRMTWSDGAKFALMTEFTAFDNGSVVLRTEYDTQCYTLGDIDRLVSGIAVAMDLLIAKECSVVEMKKIIRNASSVQDWSLVNTQENSFGMHLTDLASSYPSCS